MFPPPRPPDHYSMACISKGRHFSLLAVDVFFHAVAPATLLRHQLSVIVLADIALPPIFGEILEKRGIFVSEIHSGHVWDKEVCDQDARHTTDRGDDERPPIRGNCRV